MSFGRMRQTRIPETTVTIDGAGAVLEGTLALPETARGIVLFAHGSGSSRHSPRNRFVAGVLQEGTFATLLVDLLTLDEERIDTRTAHLRFDIGLLAARLECCTSWIEMQERTSGLQVGYFGASTGAAAALIAAARRPSVAAVVSRGGRPDLAGDELERVRAPTLLVVGGADHRVIELNQQALERLRCVKELQIVPGATHLFEEPGALEKVADLARAWFERHLA